MPSNDQVARSVALEQAYVYDVYEQFLEKPNSRPWPKVQQFLEDLEPGSIVCDVGCGSGKYLTMNNSVFNIGGDRSRRLSDVARDKDNEVMILDNLALPFRDESLDAVLSIAVVHHFTTTERRIRALRELARVLRIGGRIIISVWAMEQSNRKFESQDVLVPWHRPQQLSTPSLELTSTTNTSEDDFLPPYHAYTQSDSDSNRSDKAKLILNKKKGRNRHKGRSIDPGRSSSASSSSLSSPNETCYSFVRRAIQKLAGARRSVQRPWFLESWSACAKEPPPRRYESEKCDCCECEDVQNLPIELRRVDDEEGANTRRQTYPSNQLVSDISPNLKSRSLTDIKTLENNNLVRSKSIVPSVQEQTVPEGDKNIREEESKDQSRTLTKPRLVKQKKSICDEDAEESLDKPTDMKNLVNNLPDFKILHTSYSRGSVFKQRSLNEEIMSAERLREKEDVKRNIQKQTSLNEELIFQRHRKLDSLKDSLFSVSTSKRLQMFKTGFANKFKTSTNIEKVTGSSLKNGFVRIFQNWKSTELVSPTIPEDETVITPPPQNTATVNEEKKDAVTTSTNERRHSKEDGSDSSKDSSLQSDTSVDSEDSFASVIFVPKTDPTSPTPLSPGPISPRLSTSVPNSPRIKQSSCPTSPRIKQTPLPVYPLTKQLSSPKAGFYPTKTESDNSNGNTVNSAARDQTKIEATTKTETKETEVIVKETLSQKYSVPPIPKFKKTSLNTEASQEKPVVQQISTTNNRDERLKTIRELLRQKPGFGIRSTRSNYPIVRHSSVTNGNFRSIARPLPKLLTLELFNPETDDKDSDSSAVSSPDSVDSVVENKSKSPTVGTRFPFSPTKTTFKPVSDSCRKDVIPNGSASSMSLLEAAADVANSLDQAVNKVIKSSPRSRRRQIRSGDVLSVVEGTYGIKRPPPTNESRIATKVDSVWAEECRKHLTDFADKLSEKLLHEIHMYQDVSDERQLLLDFPSTENISDPYISRLSEELDDLSKLSAEIQKQNEYLAQLSASDSFYSSQCVKCKFTECSCGDGVKTDAKANIVKQKTIETQSISKRNTPQQHKPHEIENGSGEDSTKSVEKLETKTLDDSGTTLRSLGKNMLKNGASIDSYESEKESSSNSITSSVTTSVHFELSLGSGESSDRGSGEIQKENSTGTSTRYSDEGSTLSLASFPDWKSYKNDAYEKMFFSDEKIERIQNSKELSEKKLCKESSSFNQSLSNTSQDSLPSDNIGGAITYHRYYHVFKEGELDQLIEKHVQNLHIISSYYDHASWCIVAEKVQVWTI